MSVSSMCMFLLMFLLLILISDFVVVDVQRGWIINMVLSCWRSFYHVIVLLLIHNRNDIIVSDIYSHQHIFLSRHHAGINIVYVIMPALILMMLAFIRITSLCW